MVLATNHKLTVTAAQVSRAPVVSLDLRTKKGRQLDTEYRLRMLIIIIIITSAKRVELAKLSAKMMVHSIQGAQ